MHKASRKMLAVLLAAGMSAALPLYAADIDYIKISDNGETGREGSVDGRYASAIGIHSVSQGLSSVAIGTESISSGESAIAVGPLAMSTGISTTSLGQGAEATENAATAIGRQSSATGGGSTAAGSASSASGLAATAFGSGASASDVNAIALGQGAQAVETNTVALGQKAQANARMATSVGSGSVTTGDYATATGAASKASGKAAVASGLQSQALGGSSVAIGRDALANHEYSVALGAHSSTLPSAGTDSATVGGVTYGGFAGTQPQSTVSVGSAGSERTLTNVAAGRIDATSTDAINGSQLNAVAGQVSANASNINNLQQQIYNYGNGIDRVNKRIDDMEDDLRAGIAGATAIAFLQRPNQAGKSIVSAAVGGFRDQQAIAVGYARNSDNNKWSVKGGIGLNTRKDVNWGGSVGYQW